MPHIFSYVHIYHFLWNLYIIWIEERRLIYHFRLTIYPDCFFMWFADSYFFQFVNQISYMYTSICNTQNRILILYLETRIVIIYPRCIAIRMGTMIPHFRQWFHILVLPQSKYMTLYEIMFKRKYFNWIYFHISFDKIHTN